MRRACLGLVLGALHLSHAEGIAQDGSPVWTAATVGASFTAGSGVGSEGTGTAILTRGGWTGGRFQAGVEAGAWFDPIPLEQARLVLMLVGGIKPLNVPLYFMVGAGEAAGGPAWTGGMSYEPTIVGTLRLVVSADIVHRFKQPPFNPFVSEPSSAGRLLLLSVGLGSRPTP